MILRGRYYLGEPLTAPTHPARRAPHGRVPFGIVAGCITVYVVIAVGITVAHARHLVYQLPGQAVATSVAAGLFTILAAGVMVTLRQPQAALLLAMTVALFAFGLVAIFSIGL